MAEAQQKPTKQEIDETTTWPELAIGLYDRLTGRGAAITYDFEDMTVMVPSKAGKGAKHAEWHLDGKLTITTMEQ
ncbi:hypothetical protein [Haloarchaeobius amylolyticus]|uniref:hypothetical protein n=1 Tax=Haloarchaeobius amylolyticus TaxID=1198296 RepID=UPI00226F0502|nr:hypothetical protein [Haloarchaeobius amylolyticus]